MNGKWAKDGVSDKPASLQGLTEYHQPIIPLQRSARSLAQSPQINTSVVNVGCCQQQTPPPHAHPHIQNWRLPKSSAMCGQRYKGPMAPSWDEDRVQLWPRCLGTQHQIMEENCFGTNMPQASLRQAVPIHDLCGQCQAVCYIPFQQMMYTGKLYLTLTACRITFQSSPGNPNPSKSKCFVFEHYTWDSVHFIKQDSNWHKLVTLTMHWMTNGLN